MSRQSSLHKCECGQRVPVLPLTAYEFTWACACGESRLISWAHKDPPPEFHAPAPSLFDTQPTAGKDAA